MGYNSYEMADIYWWKPRSALMAMVSGRGKQTTEGMLAKVLRSEGYAGWRRQQRISGQDAKGGPYWVRPDFIFRSRRIAIFVDGCFWHGCPRHGTPPKGNRAFGSKKFPRNKARDARDSRNLRWSHGRVLRLWVRELKPSRRLALHTKLKRVLA